MRSPLWSRSSSKWFIPCKCQLESDLLRKMKKIRGQITRKSLSILHQRQTLREEKTGRMYSRRDFSSQTSSILWYSPLFSGKSLDLVQGLPMAPMRVSLVAGFQTFKRRKVQGHRLTAKSTCFLRRSSRHLTLPDWRFRTSSVGLQGPQNPLCHRPFSQIAKPNPVLSIARWWWDRVW